jgi:hypothetical protein
MDSITSIMAVARHGGKAAAGGTAAAATEEQRLQERRRSSTGSSPPYIKSCYLVKDGNSNDCRIEVEGGTPEAIIARKQELMNASCGTLVVVEDVTDESDDDELFSIEK